jgi:hypothetical protein
MAIIDKRAEIERTLEERLLADRDTLAKWFSEVQLAIARNDVAMLAAIASRSSRRRARAAVDRHREL